jgi:ubiquinone biosynthesis protein
MAVPNVLNLQSNVERFNQIVRILAKYGLAEYFGRRTPGFVRRRFVTADGTDVTLLPFPIRMRMALAELGTTFIKLGQMLSTRADMVGPEIADELASLQADTPVDPPAAVRQMIESELGRPVEDIFAAFDFTALASASVGQVHLARLNDGTNVVVKVQHAGIEKKVQSDLSLLGTLAQLGETNSKDVARYRPTATVEEFKRSLLRELDFTVELNNLLTFTRNFADNPNVHVPTPYPEYSSRRILTMERLEGYSIAKLDRMRADGLDLNAFADRFATAMLNMVFHDGFYHADPHPGNIFVLPGTRVGLLDCGKVGYVDEQTRDDFINIVQAFVTRDVDALTNELIALCEVPPDLDRRAYRADVADFVTEFGGSTDGALNLGAAFETMFGIIRRHHLLVPARVNMLLLVIVQLEGTARGLNPDFNLTVALQSYGADLVMRRFSPKRLLRQQYRSFQDWNNLLKSVPRDASILLEQMQRGELRIQVQQSGMQGPANRLVYGMLVAALFLGSTIVWGSMAPPLLFGMPILPMLGVLLALVLGVHLLYLIWRAP